jgi:LuxR family maltose regulon positive regulatory protein
MYNHVIVFHPVDDLMDKFPGRLNQPPRIPEKTVPRERLFRQLDVGLQARFVLVSAPAGYGKTVLILQWLRSRGFDCAWLVVEENPPAMSQFWQKVAQAISVLGVNPSGVTLELLQHCDSNTCEPFLDALLADVELADQPIRLVVDDYFHVQDPAVHQSIRYLLEHCPANFQLIMITRQDPPLPLARYRVRDQMVDIRADDLCMSVGEMAGFLELLDIPYLSPESLNLLHERTEGWAAGIQLSALALQKQSDPEEFVSAFSGSQRYVFDYLVDEVLGGLSAGQQNFLLKTSILRQLNPRLCARLLDDPQAGDTLDDLYRQNLFLHPVDDAGEWYISHGLFRDVLQLRLRRSHTPEEIRQLHLQASIWYQESGQGQEALYHARLAGAVERVADLIETTSDLLTWSSGYHTDLIQVLEWLPGEVYQSRVRLQLLFARSLLLSGKDREASLRLDEAEEHLRKPDFPVEEARRHLGRIQTHRATRLALAGRTVEASRLATEALEMLPGEDILTRAQATHTLGLAADTDGRLREAVGLYQQAVHLSMSANHRNLGVVAGSQQAFCEIGVGELAQAESTARQALQLAVIGSTELPISAYAHAALAEVFHQQGRLDEADQEIRRAVYLAEKGIPPVRWHTAVLQASIAFGRGDLPTAEAILEQNEETFARILPPKFQENNHALLCRLWIQRSRCDLADGAFGGMDDKVADSAFLQNCDQAGQVLIYCRMLICSGEKEKARRLLRHSAEMAGQFGHLLLQMQALVLLAQCAESPRQAAAHLHDALALAGSRGYRQLFLDEGPSFRETLQNYRRQSTADASFMDQLLEMPGVTAPPAVDIEPLTDRERDVLRQIARGASNQQIADQLVVSVHTVKKHAANIFIKLGVENRTEAVDRARALGVL